MLFDVYKRQHAFVILREKIAQRKALLATFALLDCDGDGKVDEAEFSSLLAAVRPGVTPSTIELAFRLLDRDNSRTLDSDEFLQVRVRVGVRIWGRGRGRGQARAGAGVRVGVTPGRSAAPSSCR